MYFLVLLNQLDPKHKLSTLFAYNRLLFCRIYEECCCPITWGERIALLIEDRCKISKYFVNMELHKAGLISLCVMGS